LLPLLPPLPLSPLSPPLASAAGSSVLCAPPSGPAPSAPGSLAPFGPGIAPRPGIAWVSARSGTGSAGPHGGEPEPSPFIPAPPVRSRRAAPSSLITVSVSSLPHSRSPPPYGRVPRGPQWSSGGTTPRVLRRPVPGPRRRRLRPVRRAAPATAEPPAAVTGGAVATAAAALRPACSNVFGIGRSEMRESGQMIRNGRPTTALSGTVPRPGAVVRKRESSESPRLSPITHSLPGGTVMLNRSAEGASPGNT